MKDGRQTEPPERERRIRDAVRSTGDVRADPAFRERLKREFIDGTITAPAVPQEQSRARELPRWWWVLVPAAAVVLAFALFLPRPVPSWAVQAVHGEGRVEIDGQTPAEDDPAVLARALAYGGRVRLLEGVSLDMRLDDRLLLALDEGADVTLPILQERDGRAPLVSEVHDGELRIKTGPGFPGTELHILTTEGRTEIVGTIVSVYKGDGYTCVCVLEGTARIGADEARLEEVQPGMLKVMFSDGSPPIVTEISEQHEADLLEFGERYKSVFEPRE